MNSVNLSLDESRKDEFYAAVKSMPTVSGVALQRVSLANFRKTVALLITTMASIYTGLAAVIAFGVVYNNARISLSERARELASLRVLGFTRGEVLRILLLELAILTLVAQPDLLQALERLGVADEDAKLGAPADTHHDRHGRGQAQGAGARDDQHGRPR